MAEKLDFSVKSKIILAKINSNRKKSYQLFKPKQILCIKAALSQDTIGVLPTGYGKSMIFEALPYFTNGTIIIISPLNSIIEEQLGRYNDSINYNQEFIGKVDSNNYNKENDIQKFKSGNLKFLIGHPEPFISKQGFKLLRANTVLQEKVSHIVVDEAHCVVQWGNGFREKFREIKLLRSLFPTAKVLALTATATIKMREDIATHLAMKSPTIVAAPMDRSNIFIKVQKRKPNHKIEESYEGIFQPLVKELQQKGALFPKTVVYTKLKWCGYGHEAAVMDTDDYDIAQRVAQYHSTCTKEMRSQVLKSMSDPNGDVKLLFATEAYSMGTDAPDIRRVIHAGVPGTLEMYIQEIGRAGRDGSPAQAVMYYNNSDISAAAKVNDDIRSFCSSESCRRQFICEHFGANVEKNFQFLHECCDNCEKVCDCDSCFCLADVDFDTGTEENTPTEQDGKDQVHCIQQALSDYFKLENSATGLPTASLKTGLSDMLAEEIARNYKTSTRDSIIKKYPMIKSTVAENIIAIMEQCKGLF